MLASSTRTGYKWFGYFYSDHLSTNDAEHSGWPVEVTTEENLKKIQDMVLEVRRLKVHEITYTVGISNKRIYNILYEFYMQNCLQDVCCICSQSIKSMNE